MSFLFQLLVLCLWAHCQSSFSKVLCGMPWHSWMTYCYKLAVFFQMSFQEMFRRSSVVFWKDLPLHALRLCLDADDCSMFQEPKRRGSLAVRFPKLVFTDCNGRVVTGVQTSTVKKLKMFFIFDNLETALKFKGEKCAKNRQTVRVLNYTFNSLLYTYLGLMKQ